MRNVKAGRLYAHKVAALFLAIVIAMALPVMAHATEDNIPEGAARVMTWRDAGFDILDVTAQRVITDMEETKVWPFYSDLIFLDEWWVDTIDVFYVNAPGVVVLVNHADVMLQPLPSFGSDRDAQIRENIIETWEFANCTCGYEGYYCDSPPQIARSGYLTFSDPGAYLFFIAGGTHFILVVEAADDSSTQPTPEPQPDAPATAPNLSTASTWAHEYINRAYEYGLIPPTLQSNYTQATTRAEFAALAVALYETVTGREITERMQFNDTADVNVQKMGGLGIVNGVGGGNFAPDRTITRQEAAALLVRLAYAIGQPLPASAATFADNASISSWAVNSAGQVQAAGIMDGVGNNNFAPNGTYTREQSIASMLRLFDLLN